jgi:protease-4
MRRFFVGFLAIVGFLALLVVIGIGGLAYWLVVATRHVSPVPEKAILRLAVHGNPGETDGTSSALRRLIGGGERASTLRELVNALDQATTDRRVLGLVVDLSDASPSLAAAQELRDAVTRLRGAGKPSFAFADSFAEAGRSSQAYYLATGFDQIWLQPSGEVGLTGFALDHPFLADGLKLLGVTPRFGQRQEFKGGIDMFVDTTLSAPLKASLQGLLDDLFAQLIDGVASGRKLAPDAVRALIDRAPLFADEAKQAGLIDAIGYADEASAQLRHKIEGTADFVGLDAYLSDVGPPHQKGDKIALIYGVGPVVRGGDDDGGGLGGGDTLSADTVAKAFRQAAADPDVRAILFRVDSPGGSYVASDTVWREVKRARSAGKPVVASMGGIAASGGYFVSMAADRVIAEPGTLTGSIGVYSGKFVLDGLWDKLGVHWDQLAAGANAGADSFNHDFTPAQWQRFQTSLDRVYADFTNRVADDRKLEPARLDAVARGRVWTGRQAVSLGLADATGGFDDALTAAKALAHLAPDAEIKLETFPPERSPLDRAFKLLGQLDGAASAVALTARLGAVFAPILQHIETLLRAGALTAPVDTP